MTTLSIEGLFHEKLLLYRELVEVLKGEKEWIVKADLEALWRVSAQKRAVVTGIEGLRSGILELLDAAGISHGMTVQRFHTAGIFALLPVAERKRLSGMLPALATVKEQIKSISRDNRRHIESRLSMVDDLLSIMTGADRPLPMYHADRKTVSTMGPRLLHREV